MTKSLALIFILLLIIVPVSAITIPPEDKEETTLKSSDIYSEQIDALSSVLFRTTERTNLADFIIMSFLTLLILKFVFDILKVSSIIPNKIGVYAVSISSALLFANSGGAKQILLWMKASWVWLIIIIIVIVASNIFLKRFQKTIESEFAQETGRKLGRKAGQSVNKNNI